MTKLKLSTIPDDKPVKVTVELPASVFLDLQAYAAILAHNNGETSLPELSKLAVSMIAHFIQTDREFVKAKRVMRDHRSTSDSK